MVLQDVLYLTSRISLPLDEFIQPMNPLRKPCSHHIIVKGHANDDEVCINHLNSAFKCVNTQNFSSTSIRKDLVIGTVSDITLTKRAWSTTMG